MQEKNKKGLIWLIIVCIVLCIGTIGFILLKKGLISFNQNKEEKPYTLKKLTDFDFKISQVEFFEAFDDYIALKVLGSDGGYSSKEKFVIFKDDKEVYVSDEDETGISKLKDKNIFYSSTGIINFKNSDTTIEKYDSLDEQNNIFVASKNDKYGLVDSDGKEITEFIYDKIKARDLTSNYLFAVKNNKVGIIDIKGKIIIPIEYDIEVEDYDGYEYYNYGKIIDDNTSYFILNKGNTSYVLDNSNKVIFEKNDEIFYDYNLEYFYIINENVYSFYSLDGEFLKDVDINGKLPYVSNISSDKKTNFLLFEDENTATTIYELNKKLEFRTYNDIYFYEIGGHDENQKVYYINNDIYVMRKDDKYQLLSKNDNKVLEKYITFQYVDLNVSANNNLENMFIACKNKNECGLLDLKGKTKADFKYEYVMAEFYDGDTAYASYPGYGILRNANEHIIISANEEIENVTCSEGNKIEDSIWSAHKNAYKTDYGLYNNNCEKMNEKDIRNYEYLENDYIVAEINDECNFDGEHKCNYYIWDDNNNLISYENKDNATIYYFLGFAKDKIYFKTDRGIYFIETNL